MLPIPHPSTRLKPGIHQRPGLTQAGFLQQRHPQSFLHNAVMAQHNAALAREGVALRVSKHHVGLVSDIDPEDPSLDSSAWAATTQ